MKTELPKEVLEQMKREDWASIQEQEDYWKEKVLSEWRNDTLSKVNKEAVSDNATNETRGALIAALEDIELRCTQDTIATGIGKRKNQTEFLLGALERIGTVARAAIDASNLNKLEPTTADPKPKEYDLSRTESACEFYDNQEQRWSLRDAGSNEDGTGESYASRNI